MPNSIEQRAIKIVIDYEKPQGRAPVDMRRERCDYDIKSDGRFIEIKGLKHKRTTWVSMQDAFLIRLGKDLAYYYIYMIYDINDSLKQNLKQYTN